MKKKISVSFCSRQYQVHLSWRKHIHSTRWKGCLPCWPLLAPATCFADSRQFPANLLSITRAGYPHDQQGIVKFMTSLKPKVYVTVLLECISSLCISALSNPQKTCLEWYEQSGDMCRLSQPPRFSVYAKLELHSLVLYTALILRSRKLTLMC